jgi:hypothetical protein
LLSLFGGVLVATAGALLVAIAVVADARWFDEHWLEQYCAVSPTTYAWESLARAVAAVAGIGAMISSLSVVPRWLGRQDPARLARASAGIALAVVMALVVSDGILRWRARRATKVEDEPALPPMMIDRTGNYAPLARRTKDVALTTRRVEYAIDSDGNRAASADHLADTRAPTVLFGGESVTLGWGVPFEKTYPAIVGAALGMQSINLAVTGFSNDQAYLRVRDALDRFEHPVAVVMLAIATQLARNVNHRRDHLVLANGRLELETAATSWLATSPLRNLLGFHSAEAIPLTRAVFRATVEASKAKGARAIFLWTNFGPPCVADDGAESPLEASLLEGTAHVRVVITPDQYLQKPGDLHPNEAGHMAIARAVLGALGTPEALFR